MEYKGPIRRPTFEELLLIEFLAKKAKHPLKPDWQQALWVEPITEERIGPITIAMNDEKPVKSKRKVI